MCLYASVRNQLALQQRLPHNDVAFSPCEPINAMLSLAPTPAQTQIQTGLGPMPPTLNAYENPVPVIQAPTSDVPRSHQTLPRLSLSPLLPLFLPLINTSPRRASNRYWSSKSPPRHRLSPQLQASAAVWSTSFGIAVASPRQTRT